MERRRVVVKAVTSLSEQLLQSKLRGGSSTPPVTESSRYARSTVPTNIDEVVLGISDAILGDNESENRRKFRQEIGRQSAIMNKRLKRLEDAGLENTPAYSRWMEEGGGQRFGLTRDGKRLTDEEAVEEYFRVERFKNMKTSTVTGSTDYLMDIQERLGLTSTDRSDVQEQAIKVFEISSKVQQYNRSAGYGHTTGSDEVQQMVAEYIEQEPGGWNMDSDDILNMVLSEDHYKTVKQQEKERAREVFRGELGDMGDFLL